MTIAVRQINWAPCWRIVPSRFPPINLFERVTDPTDIDAVIALESLTNDRIRDEVGQIQLVPPEDRVAGPGAGTIMAAFTHPNPEGSRFSDGSYGVYYAARDLDTAVAETRHHRELFMGATKQARMELDMRVYVAELKARLHDLRGQRKTLSKVYALDSYMAGQELGGRLRAEGSLGIAFDSLRHDGGQCAAVFRPRALSKCRQERHLCYVWDGAKIELIYEKRSFSY